VDAANCTPYGYADIKVWNRPLVLTTKRQERKYKSLPIEQKESIDGLKYHRIQKLP